MVIVRVSSFEGSTGVFVSLEEASFPNLPDGYMPIKIKTPHAALAAFSAGAPSADSVQVIGRKLLKELERNAGVKAAITSALSSASPCPIFLQLEAPNAAELPWESLFASDHDKFLALEPCWPIGRMMRGTRTAKRCYAATPLRMMAVLSAVGVRALGEWQSLRAAVTTSGIDIAVHLVIGEDALYRSIVADPTTPSWVSCERLEDAGTVPRALNAFDPHLVHFFCHGVARPRPMLELATQQGHAAELSDVHLAGAALSKAAPLAWLVTLNSCSGASDAEGVRSLTSELVKEGGYPAVIGMREPITDRDAHVICEEFYTDVLIRLREVFATGSPVTAEWTTSLCRARQALRNGACDGLGQQSAAARDRKWTIPILCVESAPLTIDPVAVAPCHVGTALATHVLQEMNTIERWLAGSPQTPDSVCRPVREKILALRAKLESP